MMEVPKSKAIQGMSLLPLMSKPSEWTPRVVSLEYGRSYSIRSKDFKMIVDYQGNTSFFDLKNDPGETKDMREVNPLATRYVLDISGFFLEYRSSWRVEKHGDLNSPKESFHKTLVGR
jgi:arylsulfatase A-like enzyme